MKRRRSEVNPLINKAQSMYDKLLAVCFQRIKL